jgi:acetyltransferase/esterase
MPHLSLETADIYYEVFPPAPIRNSPLLLFIHGGNGTLNGFRSLATHLSRIYSLNVLLYDRRGFSRSTLTGPQSYSGTDRIARDAADAAALIKHFGSTAVIFGNSSGAVVGMEVLLRHGEVVDAFVCHEPPLIGVIEDDIVRQAWTQKQKDLYQLYREQGHVAAMEQFTGLVRAREDKGWATGAGLEDDPYFMGNLLYWFEREVVGYVTAEVDMKALERVKEKLILCNGKDSHPEAPQVLANREMSRRLGLRLEMFEGGHLAWKDGATFSKDVVRVQEARGFVIWNPNIVS